MKEKVRFNFQLIILLFQVQYNIQIFVAGEEDTARATTLLGAPNADSVYSSVQRREAEMVA